MSSKLVSIIIPVYNAEKYLRANLDSVLAQTYKPIEIIALDDGSTDNSLKILKEEYEHRGVRVFSHKNMGPTKTQNRGYELSNGDYITFFDSDDLMAPEKTELQMKMFEQEGDDVLMTCEWSRFYDDPREADFEYRTLWQDLDPVTWSVMTWSNNWMMHGATWLIPRRTLEKSGLWHPDLAYICDHEFFCRVMLASRLVKFVPGARTYYRSFVEGSVSTVRPRRAWESAYKSLILSTENLLKAEDSPRTRLACAICFQQMIYESYPMAPDIRKKAELKVEEHGGCNLRPEGGPLFQTARKFTGWKAARRLQLAAYRFGYLRRGQRRFVESARKRAGIK